MTIRYGYLPVPTVPLCAAMAHELFERENVDVQLVKLAFGPAAFQALQAGTLTLNGAPVTGPSPQRSVVLQQAALFPGSASWATW